MSDDKQSCDLCGLTIELLGFDLKTKQGDVHFCCEGCKGIYQMLNEDDVIDNNEIVSGGQS
ncbi:MAG: heavy metal translocating P-type ATPase metal-binding domain-containing protein [Methylococcaceae bacterium]